MQEKNGLNSGSLEVLLKEFGLATYKDGFFVGLLAALILKLGIANIATGMQEFIIWVLLCTGIIVSINQAIRRKALINPPWDGFISGFGILIGLLELLPRLITS